MSVDPAAVIRCRFCGRTPAIRALPEPMAVTDPQPERAYEAP